MRENGQKVGESKRELRKRVSITREVRKGGHFSKGVRNGVDYTQDRKQGK